MFSGWRIAQSIVTEKTYSSRPYQFIVKLGSFGLVIDLQERYLYA